MYQETKKRKSPPPIVFIGVALIALGAFKFIPSLFKGGNLDSSTSDSSNPRMSLGNKILVQSQTTAGKQAGVQAFAKGD